jgi:hypothetical protein
MRFRYDIKSVFGSWNAKFLHAGKTALSLIVLQVIFNVFVTSETVAQDTVVLRDLSILENVSISDFDSDGILLDDGKRFYWDQIYSGTVSEENQQAFDRSISELGTPLFLINSRIAKRSFGLLRDPINSLKEREAELGPQNSILLQAARYFDSLNSGNRFDAVIPLLNIISLLDQSPDLIQRIPQSVRSQFQIDAESGLPILPIWFSNERKKEVLDQITAWAASKKTIPLAAAIFACTLIEQPDAFENYAWLEQFNENRTFQAWKKFAIAINEESDTVAYLRKLIAESDLDSNSVLAITASYELGLRELAQPDETIQVDGELRLLKIVAAHGTRYPETAAACLHQVIRFRQGKDKKTGIQSLQSELRIRYANTFHGRRSD